MSALQSPRRRGEIGETCEKQMSARVIICQDSSRAYCLFPLLSLLFTKGNEGFAENSRAGFSA